MSEIESARALLVEALQDLADAEAALAERGPAIVHAISDAPLRTMTADDVAASGAAAALLGRLLGELEADARGSDNIWLRAILDDGERDVATVAKGVWRDVALTGALRKGKQAQRVSYETAIALAYREELDAMGEALLQRRDACEALDEALAGRLAVLTEVDVPG